MRPHGDCFYECMAQLLGLDAQALRELAADALTEETFLLYRTFAVAGVEGFSFMNSRRAPQSLVELRSFARLSGGDTGAGQCLWADEFAMQARVPHLAGFTSLATRRWLHVAGFTSLTARH